MVESKATEPNNSPKLDIHRVRPSVFDVLLGKDVGLGKYKFGKGITIFHSPALPNTRYESVELHEITHLHLCSCTTFGCFQKFLGEAIKSRGIPDTLRPIYLRALNASVQHSWFTHEGVATASEFWIASLQERHFAEHYIESLLPNYNEALKPFVSVLLHPPLLDISTLIAGQFCEAIGCVCLNTTILEDMRDHRVVCETNWESYFGKVERDPDQRLKSLFTSLSSVPTQEMIRSAVFGFLKSRLNITKAEEFTEAYRTLKSEETFQFFDALKEVCVQAMESVADFFVEKEARISDLMSLLAQSWFTSINESGGKCIFTSSGKRCEMSVGDKLDFYLKQLDYGPSKNVDMFPQGWLIVQPDAVPTAWQVVRETKNTLYVYLLIIPRQESIQLSELLEIEPGGCIFLIHDCIRTDAAVEFRFPFKPVDSGFENAVGAVICKRNQLQMALTAIRDGGHVLCGSEFTHRALSESDESQIFLSTPFKPLVFVPKTSTLESWEGVLNRLYKAGTGRILAYHEAKDSKRHSQRNFLIIVADDGSVVYLKHASGVLFERLLQKSKSLDKINDFNEFSSLFSAAWVKRIELCCEHYFRFGW